MSFSFTTCLYTFPANFKASSFGQPPLPPLIHDTQIPSRAYTYTPLRANIKSASLLYILFTSLSRCRRVGSAIARADLRPRAALSLSLGFINRVYTYIYTLAHVCSISAAEISEPSGALPRRKASSSGELA